MPNNYNSIACIYDLLGRIVFGDALVRAQECLLPYIPVGSRILIAGGGTGWILESIAGLHPKGLIIDYVESSGRMIAMSRKRNYGSNWVSFIHQPVEAFHTCAIYDVVITPFLFDNFREDTIAIVFTKLDRQLKHDGLWLYSDFTYTMHAPLWQKLLLRIMYVFFRIISHIEAKRLMDIGKYFAAYHIEYATSHYSGFISSTAFRKA